MKTNLTYCVNKNLIPDFYYEVLTAYGLSAKNIKNSSLFIIKNIFNSYTFNKELKSYQLKSNLHANQQEVIKLTNQAITILNQKLKIKFDKNQELPEDQRKLNKLGKEAINSIHRIWQFNRQ